MEPSTRLLPFLKKSIFEEIQVLSAQENIKNLGLGFTEWDTPQFLKDLLYQSTQDGENQYGRSGGQPLLVKAIAKEYSVRFRREIDPMKEVVVCNGATGVLTNICCAYLNEGDEVITFEPGFETYFVIPALFGGKLKTFPLNEPSEGSDQWTIDFEEFEKVFNEKSRLLLLNTPQNPTGKVLNRTELEKIAEIVKKWPRLIVVVDEVYEHMCYDEHEHLRLASFPDMWERVISIYTASKTFSCAGWRVGWGISSSGIIGPLMAAQNWLNLNIHRPSQVAIAKAIEHSVGLPYNGEKLYYDWVHDTLQRKKDLLVEILKNSFLKIKVYSPEGGFFILADITEMIPLIPVKYFYKTENMNKIEEGAAVGEEADYSSDFAFVRWLATEYRIICVPSFPFYDQSHAKTVKDLKGKHLVRFALCKHDETLHAAAQILRKK